VASLIPNATYVELPGDDHLPFVGDQDALLDEIERFLAAARTRADADRVLVTLLCVELERRPRTRTAATTAAFDGLRTVVDLVAGSGLRFTDRGMHVLAKEHKAWRVYAVRED